MKDKKMKKQFRRPTHTHAVRDIRRAVIYFSFFIFHFSFAVAATPYAFLTLPVGAREAAMGETGVSHARGGGASWWNPALLTRNGGAEFDVVNWFADGRGSFGGVSVPGRWGGLGAYYFNLGIPDIEVRDRPGPAVGTFTAHNTLAAGGAAFHIGGNAAAGMTVKWYQDDIYGDAATVSGMVDVGAVWQRGALTLGATASNMELWDYVTPDLPITYRAGGAYRWQREEYSVTAAGEAVTPDAGGFYMHFGAEAGWRETLFLRSGYMAGHDSRAFSFGLGVAKGAYRTDVAVTPYDNGLGQVWRVGVGVGW